MSASLLLLPPVAFGVFLLVLWGVSRLTSGLAAAGTQAEGKNLPYACGEEFPGEKAEPDYTSFFPFAIFFTLMHVVALMLATMALMSSATLNLGAGIIYLIAVGLSLAILFSK